MKALLLSVGLLIVIVQADEQSWSIFKIKYRKIYTNQTEQQLRQKVFNENLQTIEEHNKKYDQGLVSYKLGVNKFADVTDEEFAAMSKTLQADEAILKSEETTHDLTNNGTKELPESIDWRTKSVVTEVKDQGTCGSCWAFSATGTIESQLAIQTGELKSLSEQQLIDCDTATGNVGCSGGVVQLAINYVAEKGITLETNYPYQAVQQTCRSSKTKNPVAWTERFVNILQNNETDLKQVVGLVGPVSVAINSVPIKLYQEGIFDGTCSNAIDHAVLAVGYGTDTTTGRSYWIIKNSWGPEWGEQGYFKLLMGRNLCGVALQACYPILKNNSGYPIKGGSFSILLLFIYLFVY